MVFSITFEGGMPLMLCCFFLFNLAHLRVVIALFPNPFELRGWDFTLGPTKSWKLFSRGPKGCHVEATLLFAQENSCISKPRIYGGRNEHKGGG